MKVQRSSFVIVGLGAFGGTVASELARFGNHVLGIDLDEHRANRFADDLAATAITDATDEIALRDLGVERYDHALIAIGEEVEASILAAMNFRLLGVRKIWAKAAHRTHHRILTKIGVDRVILPEQEMGKHVAQVLNTPSLRDYIGLGNGFSVVSLNVPERRDGAALHDLKFPPSVTVMGAMRGSVALNVSSQTLRLQTDDILLLLGKHADLRDVSKVL